MNQCGRCQQLFPDNVRFCPKDGTRLHRHDRPEERYIGETLGGQFVIESVAGKGGMGTVYRAVQRSIDRQVAVKILHPDLVAEKEVVKRFLREGRAAARLQHPNIVTVHMVGETQDGVPFLVMELVEGESLESLLEQSGTFEEHRALGIARQIAFGLAEAHRQGIVHRDLKPANILISPKGRGREIVKILDFGIAKVLNTSEQSLAVTTGLIFGTPHYLAPEQASGEAVDGRTDLYALGVILFRMLTGVLPFDGDNAMQVVLRHLRDAPPSLKSLASSIDPETEALVLSCLSKRPSERPPSADAVVDAIDAILPQRDPTGPYSQHELGTSAKTPSPEIAAPKSAAPSPVRPQPLPAPVSARAPAAGAASKSASPVRPQAPLHLPPDDDLVGDGDNVDDDRPTIALEREPKRPVIAARRPPIGRAVRPPSKKVKYLDQSLELDSREMRPVKRSKGIWLAIAAIGVGGTVGLAAALGWRTGPETPPAPVVATPTPTGLAAPDLAPAVTVPTKVATKKKGSGDKGDKPDKGDKSDSDLPMTVIGPTPTTPRRLDGPTPAPAPAPKLTPAGNPVAPAPAPAQPPAPRPEPIATPTPAPKPAEPEPTYPPPAPDPTTVQ